MRFSKSTSRGFTKTGCVCESTKPGKTTWPPQSISIIFFRFLDPGIRQGVFGFGNGNNLSAYTQHSAVFNNAEIVEFRPSPRSRFAGWRTEGNELANV